MQSLIDAGFYALAVYGAYCAVVEINRKLAAVHGDHVGQLVRNQDGGCQPTAWEDDWDREAKGSEWEAEEEEERSE